MHVQDGRVLDPTAPAWNWLQLPNLRGLAAKGINFARHYTTSPQWCLSLWSYTNRVKTACAMQRALANVDAHGPVCAQLKYAQQWHWYRPIPRYWFALIYVNSLIST